MKRKLFVLFERTVKIINLQRFHILHSSSDIWTDVIFKRDDLWRQKVCTGILTYWQIVYIFKIIE